MKQYACAVAGRRVSVLALLLFNEAWLNCEGRWLHLKSSHSQSTSVAMASYILFTVYTHRSLMKLEIGVIAWCYFNQVVFACTLITASNCTKRKMCRALLSIFIYTAYFVCKSRLHWRHYSTSFVTKIPSFQAVKFYKTSFCMLGSFATNGAPCNTHANIITCVLLGFRLVRHHGMRYSLTQHCTAHWHGTVLLTVRT